MVGYKEWNYDKMDKAMEAVKDGMSIRQAAEEFAAIGYPRSRNEVIAMVQRLCDSRNMSVHVTHGWWERFCFRHPEISLRITSALSYARAKGQNEEALSNYFDVLEETLDEHKLHDKPALIFNVDETGLPLSPSLPKGVCRKGTKHQIP